MLRLCGGLSASDRPPRRMSPAVGVSKPASIINVVVLPEPEGPRRVRNSPRPIARSSAATARSEEHTSELQSLMRISYAVFCLKTKKQKNKDTPQTKKTDQNDNHKIQTQIH